MNNLAGYGECTRKHLGSATTEELLKELADRAEKLKARLAEVSSIRAELGKIQTVLEAAAHHVHVETPPQ